MSYTNWQRSLREPIFLQNTIKKNVYPSSDTTLPPIAPYPLSFKNKSRAPSSSKQNLCLHVTTRDIPSHATNRSSVSSSPSPRSCVKRKSFSPQHNPSRNRNFRKFESIQKLASPETCDHEVLSPSSSSSSFRSNTKLNARTSKVSLKTLETSLSFVSFLRYGLKEYSKGLKMGKTFLRNKETSGVHASWSGSHSSQPSSSSCERGKGISMHEKDHVLVFSYQEVQEDCRINNPKGSETISYTQEGESKKEKRDFQEWKSKNESVDFLERKFENENRPFQEKEHFNIQNAESHAADKNPQPPNLSKTIALCSPQSHNATVVKDEANRPITGSPCTSFHSVKKASNVVKNSNHNSSLLSFTSHAPYLFQKIHRLFGWDLEEICTQLFHPIWENTKTPGKSKARIYYAGAHWVVKTVTENEQSFLCRLLPHYVRYVEAHPNTRLPIFVGHFSVSYDASLTKHENAKSFFGSLFDKKLCCNSSCRTTRTAHVVVMRTVFESSLPLFCVYDLKGSTTGRSYGVRKDKDVGIKKESHKNSLFVTENTRIGLSPSHASLSLSSATDLNEKEFFSKPRDASTLAALLSVQSFKKPFFLDAQLASSSLPSPPMFYDSDLLPTMKVHLALEDSELVISQIQKDCNFLQSFSVMDYSLLLGVSRIFDTHSHSSSQKTETGPKELSKGENSVLDSTKRRASTSFRNLRNGMREIDVNSALSHAMINGICSPPLRSSEGHLYYEIYFFRMIDVLQQYTLRKKLEHFFRGMCYGFHSISAVPPAAYAKRFQKLMKRTFACQT